MHTWVQETKQILIRMWARHSPVEIAEQVNLWHRDNGRAGGAKFFPATTDMGVMYQALKLGFISQDELDVYGKQRRRTRARKNYVPARVRTAVLERDGYQCLLCGATEDLTIDHIVSIEQGGTSEADNLQTLCASCNRTEKGMAVVDFRKPYVKLWCSHCGRFHYKNEAAAPHV
jgi:transcription elongation factor Elf1